jgi:hypothetical protein
VNLLVPAPHPSLTHAGSPCSATVAAAIAIAVAVVVAEAAAAGRAVYGVSVLSPMENVCCAQCPGYQYYR